MYVCVCVGTCGYGCACTYICIHILWKVEINLWNCPLGWPPTLIFEARSLTLGLADSAWLASKPRKTGRPELPSSRHWKIKAGGACSHLLYHSAVRKQNVVDACSVYFLLIQSRIPTQGMALSTILRPSHHNDLTKQSPAGMARD